MHSQSALILSAILLVPALVGCGLVNPPSPGGTASGDQTQLFYAREGQHPEQQLVNAIDGAQHSVDTAMYSFTEPSIVAAYSQAAQRHVSLRLIVDQSELRATTSRMGQDVGSLCDLGVPVKENVRNGYTLMHMKQTEVDGSALFLGSFNDTITAARDNWEVLARITTPSALSAAEDSFGVMWNDSAHFVDACSGVSAASSPTRRPASGWSPVASPRPAAAPGGEAGQE